MHSELIQTLATRFTARTHNDPQLTWENILPRLSSNPEALAVIARMENTGGEPQIVCQVADKLLIVDCYQKVPAERKNLCYDEPARIARKKFPPASSALAEVAKIGAQLLTEDLYLLTQKHIELDLTISTWLHTPEDVRTKGGAIFGDRRFGRTFIYHNGADSYYAVRGYRTFLLI